MWASFALAAAMVNLHARGKGRGFASASTVSKRSHCGPVAKVSRVGLESDWCTDYTRSKSGGPIAAIGNANGESNGVETRTALLRGESFLRTCVSVRGKAPDTDQPTSRDGAVWND